MSDTGVVVVGDDPAAHAAKVETINAPTSRATIRREIEAARLLPILRALTPGSRPRVVTVSRSRNLLFINADDPAVVDADPNTAAAARARNRLVGDEEPIVQRRETMES